MKGYSTFHNAPTLLEPYNQIVKYHIQDTLGESYSSAEMQSMYSTTPIPSTESSTPVGECIYIYNIDKLKKKQKENFKIVTMEHWKYNWLFYSPKFYLYTVKWF